MEKINIRYIETPLKTLILGSFNNAICLCDWQDRKKRTTIDKRLTTELKTSFIVKNNDLLSAAALQLNEYFKKQRKFFDLPLLMVGTDFQKRVWQALVATSYGETLSYLTLAQVINKPNAVRAVANANAANALAILIPCHRIISKTAHLTGYSGGVEVKKKLLYIENKDICYKN